VQEREATSLRREATMKKKEIEAVEGIKQLGEKVTWCNLATYVPKRIENKFSAALLLVKMKRSIDTLANRIGYGPHF
jgi:hypothetical protein